MYFFNSKRILLRSLLEDDIYKNYGNWLNDIDVCKYNSHHRFPCTSNELKSYIETVNTNKDCIVLAVIHKKDSVHIGNVSLQNINFIDRNAEIAFLFGEKEYWKHGYAKEAAEIIIRHAFEQLGLIRIYFGTLDENISMQRLGESLGFIIEGKRRMAMYKNGEYSDILEYGLLKEEWKL